MHIFKNLKIALIILILTSGTHIKAKATEECFEGVSRSIFKFNMAFDDMILEPIANGYNKLPEPIKNGTSNFTSNIAVLLSIPNSLLQGNISQVGHSTGSFIVNSTVGILGIFNPAEKIGLKPYKGRCRPNTRGIWCWTWLLFSPSYTRALNCRDSFGLVADTFIDPFAHVTIRENELFGISGNDLDYFSVKGTTAIDFRADNSKNFDSLEKNSIDLYSSLKSIYLQDRENKIRNSIEDQDEWGA